MTNMRNSRPVILLLFLSLALCLVLSCILVLKNWKEGKKGLISLVCPSLPACADAFLLYNESDAVMIDAGEAGDADLLLKMMKKREITSLSAMILTHYDKDHIGGAARIIEKIPVKTCYMTCGSEDSEEYDALIKSLQKTGTRRLVVTDPETFSAMGATFTIYPPLTGVFEKSQDNNLSLITSVTLPGDALLFTGDAEKERMTQYMDSQYDGTQYTWLKVPHHGRDKKTVSMLLKQFVPKDAVICSSKDEPENDKVINLLEEAGTKVWLTRKKTAEFTLGEEGAPIPAGKTPEEETEDKAEQTTASENKEEDKVQVDPPEFSLPGGFYEGEQKVELTAAKGNTIYYSLDCSEPTDKSVRYENSITINDPSNQPNVHSNRTDFYPYFPTTNGYKTEVMPGWYTRNILPDTVDKCAVIRAVAVDEKGNRSPVVTASYFINYKEKTGYDKLPVLSLVSDPDDLFDKKKGIMVNGERYEAKLATGALDGITDSHRVRKYCNTYAGRGRKWERKVHMDYFSEGGEELVFSQEAGIRLHGNQSRVAEDQKSYNLYARKEYDGNKTFRAPFFEDGLLQDTVTLMRGIDIRNYYLGNKMNSRTMDSQQYKLAQVFLDGEYWGIYAIQERYNSDEFMKTHYNLDKEDYSFAKGNPYTFQIKNGDPMAIKTSFREVRDFAMTKDLSKESNYQALCHMMDMQSFIDCYAAKIYTGDQDWSWRKNQMLLFCDQKWHWMTFDIDYGAGAHDTAMADINTFETTRILPADSLETDPLFPYLLKNDQFRRDFSNTFLDLGNEIYSGKNVQEDMNRLMDLTEGASILESKRYPTVNVKTGVTQSEMNVSCYQIADYFDQRFSYASGYLASYFGLKGSLQSIQIKNEQPDCGTIGINTITPDLDRRGCWTGSYYTDFPVTLKAEPEEGYVFDGWEVKGGTLSDPDKNETELTFSKDVVVKARFAKEK